MRKQIKKRINRWLAGMLAFLLLVSLTPLPVLAAEPETVKLTEPLGAGELSQVLGTEETWAEPETGEEANGLGAEGASTVPEEEKPEAAPEEEEPASVPEEERAPESDLPMFEALEFMTTAFPSGTWIKGETFSPTTLSYDLPLRSYSTSTLTLQGTTRYDTEKYTAVAEYTDLYGNGQSIRVNSGALTKFPDMPFGDSVLTITLQDQRDGERKTLYTFHVNRPRDTGKTFKSSSMVFSPSGRSLLHTKYQGMPEGTFFKADENGTLTTGTGVSGSHFYYRVYGLENLEGFSLTLTGNTVYQHLRYSVDGGGFRELPQGGGATEQISFSESGTVKVEIQVLDDHTYMENIAAGREGFEGGTPNTYTLWAEQVAAGAREAQILSGETELGDWYPAFDKTSYNYNIIVPSDQNALTLNYTVTDGATVKLGTKEQFPAEDGTYTLALSASNQTVHVTSGDGQITNSYQFRYQKRSSLDLPDKVVDYLVINSQYTNAPVGMGPETTLAASLKSLGNFGGYITYYYEEPLIDDPNNRYGVDFYVYGNANVDSSTATGTSFFEPGQVWVSENGRDWYALAGSAHYEEEVDWNYTVDYRRTANGRTAWTDNHGNGNDGTKMAGAWPLASNYYMNGLAGQDTVTLSGILLPAADGSITGNGSSDAYPVNWGYADTFANGKMGEDVNPYLPNENHKHKTNGFDLAWAVDANGTPVDVSGMEFHYVKVVTASNIWHNAFGDKSTEVTAVVRTKAQSEAAGVTAAPAGVTFSDGASRAAVNFTEGKKVYEIDLGDMRYVSLSVNGAAAEDNIYVNNQRVEPGEAVACRIPAEGREKLVRLVVQNGEKEPLIYLLKLRGSGPAGDGLVEGIKLNVNGTVRRAQTTDGVTYEATVGYTMNSIKIVPVADPAAALKINGADPEESYTLQEGENVFRISASLGEETKEVTLCITREAAPDETGKITVFFTLLGDQSHGAPDGEEETHTFHKKNLTTWISRKECTVEAPATVLDVVNEALKDSDIAFETEGGNYIAEIGGLKAFDNGALSGWMYMQNGSYPAYGVMEQKVQNGDEILFHYTDDYTAEAQGSSPEDTKPGNFDEIYRATADYLAKQAEEYTIQVGSTGGEWLAIGLERTGMLTEKQAADYYQNAEEFVKKNVNDKEQLHRVKSTENSRLILGLTAIGKDVTNVAGHNLLAGLTDMSYVKKQGINGPIWALTALDSHGYELPAGGDVTREGLLEEILNRQLADGGWALSGKKADPDITAMALTALAPYGKTDSRAEAALEKALGCLSDMQMENGGYASWGAYNSESCAQVIVALTALGINPASDSRFVKNGNSVLDALLGFAVEGGGFSHTANGAASGMAAEQSYNALAAYSRFLEGKSGLYDMSDIAIPKDPAVDPEEPEIPPTPEEPEGTPTPEQPEKPDQPEGTPTPEQPEKPENPGNRPGNHPDQGGTNGSQNNPGSNPGSGSGQGQQNNLGTSQTGSGNKSGNTRTLAAAHEDTEMPKVRDGADGRVEPTDGSAELFEDQVPQAAGGGMGQNQEAGEEEGQKMADTGITASGVTGAGGSYYVWVIVAAAAAVVLVAVLFLKKRQQAEK